MKWTRYLSSEVKTDIFDNLQRNFEEPLASVIGSKHNCPSKLRFFVKQGTHTSLLHRMNESGMMDRRKDTMRTTPLSHHADTLEMAIFSVTKNENWDRLISCPRIPNDFCVVPPDSCFPEPSHVANTTLNWEEVQQGFHMGDGNIFHNLILPRHLRDLFLMSVIRLKELPAEYKTHCQAQSESPSKQKNLYAFVKQPRRLTSRGAWY